MKEQMKSWNEGDISAFMNHYWKSDSLQFVSKKGISKGWKKLLKSYQKSYSTNEKMGDLKFSLKQVNQNATNYVFVVGRWDLFYNNKSSWGGYFTPLWEKKTEGWRIVVDHTS